MKRGGRDCRSYTSDCLYGLSLFIENFKDLLPCQVRNHLVAFKPSPYHSTKPVWRVTTSASSLNDLRPIFRHFILPVAGTENITAYFSDLWDGYSISGVFCLGVPLVMEPIGRAGGESHVPGT